MCFLTKGEFFSSTAKHSCGILLTLVEEIRCGSSLPKGKEIGTY